MDEKELIRQIESSPPEPIQEGPGYIVISSEGQGRDFIDKVRAAGEAQNLRGIASDINFTIERNQAAQRFMEEHLGGRPGHYYGRDCIIEGEVPAVAYFVAPNEFDGDPEWYKDDRKFQSYMDNHPEYSWLKRR